MEHDLKCWPEYYQAVKNGRKPFEIRKEDDRRFAEGDTLRLREWEPMTEAYTGDVTHATVTYVLRGGPWLPDGYVCMGIECEALAWALRYARRWACHDGALDQALQVYERGKQ